MCGLYCAGPHEANFFVACEESTLKKMSRRRFIATAALSAAAARMKMYGQDAARVTLTVPRQAAGARIPDSFVGLSYEVQQLASPEFFSAKNAGLIAAFKRISTHGVLRLGGNTSEYATWKATANAPDPPRPETREVVGQPKAQYYAVTPESVRNLAGFLEATGWKCIYGIGMGTSTPQRAAEEAEFVAPTLGEKLEYFQIGNEVDLFGSHLRDPKTWNARSYLDEWLEMARAIEARVPAAKFGMPDVAARIDWLTEIADRWATIKNPPRLAALTHHYYFGGPATNPDVNIPNLLSPATAERVQRMATTATTDAKKMGVRVRMTEGNTCYRGGKPGVSDVFAAALWAADYSLQLASNHYSGINLHGGTGNSVANSVGGSLPGDALLSDEGETPQQIAAHPHPFYTPIATFGSEYVLEPVAYGLKFAGNLSGGTLFEADFAGKLQAGGVNATAYAAKMPDGRTSVIILNKDGGQDLDLTLDFGSKARGEAETEILHASALDSRETQITRLSKAERLENGRIVVSIPHATGMRVTMS